MGISRFATAHWDGDFKQGGGRLDTPESGLMEAVPYGFNTRFGDRKGTNPEELIAAAHAGCFSMALSAGLGKSGFTPTRISSEAKVHLEKVGEGFAITKIELVTEGEVPGIDEAAFLEHAEGAKKNCPVSKALGAVEITLTAKLVS